MTHLDYCLEPKEEMSILSKDYQVDTLNFLCEHLAVALNKSLNVELLIKTQGDIVLSEIYEKCQEEMNFMKVEKISDSSFVAYFDLLKSD